MSSDPLPTIKQALVRISKLQSKLDAETHARTEPIAIIGMACRIPGGATTPEELWRLLEAKVDTVGPVPPERWRVDGSWQNADDADHRSLRWGSFLKNVDLFDAGFFGISPREAKALDPQQRLLLEVTWEALERAGQPPEQLIGTRTGVFVGIVGNDYEALCNAAGSSRDIYTVTGNGHCFPPGRVSYVLGLQGPSMAVDTACSSSLVALHLACQSLRAGESTLALAGGVSVMLTPLVTELLATSHALSPDGRSKTFDAEANGFVRGEGCGVVVLKRLSDAVADGDPILAVIRGSAVNHDGRSTGLTAPNVQAQKALIQQALKDAGVSAAALDYIETHGTGTPLGDPIEIEALSEAIGQPRSDESDCVLGAVKTNIGHLEAAAGVAGVIKVVLALQHQAIPANLHLRNLNPRISLTGTPFVLPREMRPWRAGKRPRLAGVSSFGMSGTNAHVVVEEAPRPPPREPRADSPWVILPLSARSLQALRDLAQSYLTMLASTSSSESFSLIDIAYTVGVRRSHHDYRLALGASSREELRGALRGALDGTPQPSRLSAPIKVQRRPKIVFVFPGQGSQWPGMGRALFASQPTFRAAIAQCDEAIRREVGWSLIDELHAEAGSSRLDHIDVIQPALFAVGVALAALWRSWGIEPNAVVGHSMGEVTAAHVSGALGLADAVRIICQRAKLLLRLRGQGAMALVELSLAEAEAALAGYENTLSIAASNSPRSTVLSGDLSALEEVLSRLGREGVFCRRVKVDVASHSPQVDAIRGDLLATLRGVAPQNAQLAMYSTVMNKMCTGMELDATYWAQNLRAPVLFSEAVQKLIETEHTIFVEMSPHPVLLPAITEGFRHRGRDGVGLLSMYREQDPQRTLLETLGELYVRGYDVDWRRLYPTGGVCLPLPTYPWQRERYWIDAATQSAQALRDLPRTGSTGHPLLGRAFDVALQPRARFWEQEVTLDALPYLADHQLEGEAVLPATAYLEMALGASAEAFGSGRKALKQVVFERMLALSNSTTRRMQVVLGEEKDGLASFQILSQAPERSGWVKLAAGYVQLDEDGLSDAPLVETPREIEERCEVKVSGAAHYQRLRACGLDYGASFRGVEELWLGKEEVLGRVRAPDDVAAQASHYTLHPAQLDACLQVAAALLMTQGGLFGAHDPLVPMRVDSLRVFRRPGRSLWVHGKLRPSQDAGNPSLELLLIDDAGHVVAEAQGISVRRLAPSESARREAREDWLYAIEWRQQGHLSAPAPARAAGPWLLLAGRDEFADALAALLQARGEPHVRISTDVQDTPDEAVLERVVREHSSCRGLLYLGNLGAAPNEATRAGSPEGEPWRGCLSVLNLIRAVSKRRWRDVPRLWLVTRGAQPGSLGGDPLSVWQAPLWGLGRTLALEHPEFRCARIDVSPELTAQESAEALLRELCTEDDEDQIALRSDGRYVARLVKTSFSALSQTAGVASNRAHRGETTAAALMPFGDGKTYLITGGLGGLGLHLAGWLTARGARNLVLIGRSGPSPAANAAIAAMQAAGATVLVMQADVSQRAEVAAVLADIEKRLPPLRGIIHAAMVLHDRTLMDLDTEDFHKVMAPKVQGAWNLHTLTLERELDFFILFSSAAALLGSPGQGNYAAANAFLDALAHDRRARGLRGLSVNWGLFSEVGIIAGRQRLENRLVDRGIAGMEPSQGLEVLGALVSGGAIQAGVMKLSLRQWCEFYPSMAGAPFFAELRATESATQQRAGNDPPFRHTLAQAAPVARARLLEGYISEHLARILHQDSTRVDRLATLGSLGVDSLMALELRNRLEASLGLRLSVATLFGYPTIAALAEHLLDKLNLANAAAEEVGKQASPLGEEGTRSTAEAAGAEIANVDDLLASIDRSLERVENLMKGQPGGRS